MRRHGSRDSWLAILGIDGVCVTAFAYRRDSDRRLQAPPGRMQSGQSDFGPRRQ